MRAAGSRVNPRLAEFIRVRPCVRRVHAGSLGSLVCALVLIGFMRGR